MVVKTETLRESDIVLMEADKRYSRDTVTVALGEGILVPGAVLGLMDRNVLGAVTAGGGNTGDGVPTAATPGQDIQIGTYELICIAAATNAGTFAVKTPSGERLVDELTVGVAFASSHLGLTIADGAADFVVGDKFTVAVSGSDKWAHSAAVQVAAKAGSERAGAVLINSIDATAADVSAVVLRRLALVNRANLTFEASVDLAAERQAKVDELEAVGILARTGA